MEVVMKKFVILDSDYSLIAVFCDIWVRCSVISFPNFW